MCITFLLHAGSHVFITSSLPYAIIIVFILLLCHVTQIPCTDLCRGACLFESLLLDYDVTSNWGNWVAAAGLTGGRVNAFNITKQSKVSAAASFGAQVLAVPCRHHALNTPTQLPVYLWPSLLKHQKQCTTST